MTPPDEPPRPGEETTPFIERMLERFHELVPEVSVVIVPQEPPPTAVGLSPAQVSQQTAAAMAVAVSTVRELWPLAGAGLPAPATVDTSWEQESGYTASVLAVAHARHPDPVPDALDRVAAAERELQALGWVTTRRDPHPSRSLRLLARHGPTLVEVIVWPRPCAYDLRVHHGPVLVGSAGTALIAAGTQTISLASETP
jgi:hypothetical protein